MRKIIFIISALLLFIPFVFADIPPLPNEKIISVNHEITNVNNYPDYILFATADNVNRGPGFSMCPLEIIQSDGLVRYNHYRQCSISVYAIKKSDTNENQLKAMNSTQLESLVNSESTIKLFSGFYFSKAVLATSKETEENVSHSIDSSKFQIINPINNTIVDNKTKKICPIGSINEEEICKMTLSNGRLAEIKIMPETASEKAIERLGELGFDVTLKEIGKDKDTKPVYELTGNKQGKFLGIFKIITKVKVQVDAETGNTKVIKPWWSFLASGI
jgi:hypothetical protein